MENKNNLALSGVILLVIGIFVGWLIFSDEQITAGIPSGMHQMGNGEMMQNGMMGMNDAMGSMMVGLQGKTGDEFDKAFLSEMIMHHRGAVVMAEAVLKTSKRPELLKLANDIIKAQTKEINQMKSWETTWFGN